MTVFPNVFQHKTQYEASMEVHRWWPLVERECSADLSFFLCSLYAPPCTILDTALLPCRELCLRVQRGCLPALDYLYHSWWPDSLNCERFPRGGEEVCIDRPQNSSQVSVPPTSDPIRGEITFDGGSRWNMCARTLLCCSWKTENSSLSLIFKLSWINFGIIRKIAQRQPFQGKL